MGNSHIGVAVDCNGLHVKCFNAASGSQDLYYTDGVLRKNIGLYKHLKVLVLNLSHFSLGIDSEEVSVYLARDYFLYYRIWPKNGGLVRLAVGSSAVLTHRDFFWRDLWAKVTPFFGIHLE